MRTNLDIFATLYVDAEIKCHPASHKVSPYTATLKGRIMSKRILVVEDSVESLNLVKRALGSSCAIDSAASLSEADRLLNKNKYDLVLLDVMLPDGDGYKLCSLLQADDELKNTPVIFLTAKNALTDKVLGFQVGADDFITKPFDALELKARVEARLRKRERDRHEADLIRIGDLEINKTTQKASINDGGKTLQLDLTPIEFKILIQLAREPNSVLSREAILNAVWGENVYIYHRSVDTHVSKLRKKMGDKAAWIESVHGTGYRFQPTEQGQAAGVPIQAQSSELAVGISS
jgi:DNA-binding response OmpR family regulator